MRFKRELRLPAAGAALVHRDFTLLWAGQFISTLGTQVQTVALGWLVYKLTGSAALLGGIGLARAIPTMALSLFGGTLADQMDRRKLLLISQSLLAACSALLAVVISIGDISVAALYGFAVITAAAAAIDSPASQAFIPALVPRDILPNALTLNILSSDTASVVGPACGGLIIGWLGVAAAYWFDAFSFIAVVAALLAMSTRANVIVTGRRGMAALIDGLRFVRDRPVLWQLMLVDFFAVLLASSDGLLPIFAERILKVGASGLGLLYAAISVGSVVGAAVFAFIPRAQQPRRPGMLVMAATVSYGAALAVFGLSRIFILSLALLALAGGLDAIGMAMRHVVRQLATPDELRGRVGALSSVFSSGGPRLGQFQSGMVASATGAGPAMVIGGAACVVVALAARWWAKPLWHYHGQELSPAGATADGLQPHGEKSSLAADDG